MADRAVAVGAAQPEASFWRYWRAGTNAVAIALASAVAGAALVWIGSRFDDAGPLVMVALVALPLVAFLIVEDPRIGLAVLFGTFPFSTLISTIGPLPLQPVEAAAMFVIAVVALARVAERSSPFGWHPALIWALALFMWTLIAFPSAPDRVLAVKQIASLAGAIAFTLVALAVLARVEDVRWVVAALVAVGGVAAAFALATGGPPQAVRGGAVVADRLSGPFNQPNQLGSFSGMLALTAAGLALGARSARVRVGAALAMIALLGALALSLSRGAWIGTAAGALVFVITSPQARRALFALAIPILIAAVAVVAYAPESPQVQIVGARLEALTTQSPYDSRDQIWAEAQRQTLADPWTGQGPGNFPEVSTRAASEASTVYADHAHNLLLNWSSEAGLPAALFVALLALALWRSARTARRRATDLRDAALVAGLGAGLFSVVVHGMVDYPLGNQVLWFTVWTLIACLLAAQRALAERPEPPTGGHPPDPTVSTR